jgi:hypothetical protein
MTQNPRRGPDPAGAALLAWAVPGAGHLFLGKWAKALLYFLLISGTFFAGWAMSDFDNIYFERGRWHVIPQMGVGIATFAIGLKAAAANPKDTVMPLFEMGTLYTMVAGLLNVLVVMDAALTSMRIRR